jgi:hypothetical protein
VDALVDVVGNAAKALINEDEEEKRQPVDQKRPAPACSNGDEEQGRDEEVRRRPAAAEDEIDGNAEEVDRRREAEPETEFWLERRIRGGPFPARPLARSAVRGCCKNW